MENINEDKTMSYTAASTFPAKILHNKELLKIATTKNKIIPIHFQINPTNLCSLSCPFCSCANRKKNEVIPFNKLSKFMRDIKRLGCQSITTTGGGEPCLYPQINEFIDLTYSLGIKIGLVTNGTAFDNLKTSSLKKITWCRISHADHRDTTMDYLYELKDVLNTAKNVDWAFSYVLSENPDYNKLAEIVRFANTQKMTHVRVVSDLLNLNYVPDMDKVKNELLKRNIDDSLVVYQGRKEFVCGREKCLISLLKPVLTPTGHIVACCGWQYRGNEPSRDYDIGDNMGKMEDIEKIIKKQKYYNGSNCYRCYYDNYNKALEILISNIHHKEFI